MRAPAPEIGLLNPPPRNWLISAPIGHGPRVCPSPLHSATCEEAKSNRYKRSSLPLKYFLSNNNNGTGEETHAKHLSLALIICAFLRPMSIQASRWSRK